MSQKDKVTSRRSKIKDILTRYGALSTESTTKILNERYRLHFNKKTIERDLLEMKKGGVIIANPPMGREQTYSASPEQLSMSPFLIDQLWKDLDSIRHQNSSEDSIVAFFEIRSLIKMLPPSISEKLKGDVQRVANSIAKKGKVMWDPMTRQFDYPLGSVDVEFLIGKVSEVLHEQFEKTQRSKLK